MFEATLLRNGLGRRSLLASTAGLVGAKYALAANVLAEDAAIPDRIAPGTKLVIGDPVTQKALELSGAASKLPFTVEWANISGGPQTIEAFRARALHLGSVADIPPIQATWIGLNVKVVAAKFRTDPLQHPIYVIGTAPGSGIERLSDLKGKKIAFSPGQAQGALVIRVLKSVGLGLNDVQLVELPSVGDAYVAALASRLVDAAPIADTNRQRYIQNYSKDGARALLHGLRDDASYLYLEQSTLRDPDRAAAVRAYVRAWAQAARWVDAHPDEWIRSYYVRDQGLKPDAGRFLVDAAGTTDIPTDWTDVIRRQQETNDLLAAELKKPKINAETLFDRRFERVAGEAFAES
jgi:sulfonate transport system substrate-binding protein